MIFYVLVITLQLVLITSSYTYGKPIFNRPKRWSLESGQNPLQKFRPFDARRALPPALLPGGGVGQFVCV